jgi:multiple sugar transport system permease protein
MQETGAWELLRREIAPRHACDGHPAPMPRRGRRLDGEVAARMVASEGLARSRPRKRRRKRLWPAPWAYLIPVLALYGVCWVGPAVFSVYLSFFDWDMASPQKLFVGLDNYRRVLIDPLFYVALRNTLLYVLGTVGLGTASGLGLALLIQSLPRGREVYRFVFFLPVVTSITVVSLVWLYLLNTQVGFVNQLLRLLGITGPNWLNDPTTALLAIVIVGL